MSEAATRMASRALQPRDALIYPETPANNSPRLPTHKLYSLRYLRHSSVFGFSICPHLSIYPPCVLCTLGHSFNSFMIATRNQDQLICNSVLHNDRSLLKFCQHSHSTISLASRTSTIPHGAWWSNRLYFWSNVPCLSSGRRPRGEHESACLLDNYLSLCSESPDGLNIGRALSISSTM